MIGRFLGDDVPAAGFSIGFERMVDLVELPVAEHDRAIAIVHAADADPATVVAVRDRFLRDGRRVRLLRRPKKLSQALDALAVDGIREWVSVDAGSDPSTLEPRSLA